MCEDNVGVSGRRTVQVLAADDDGTVHLGRDDTAGQDTATDGDEAGEGALLVCTKWLAIGHSSD